MSKDAHITINTPLSRTDPFVLENLVNQGIILGPVLNNCSLDRITKEGSGYQMGLASTKSSEHVDDIADVNRKFSSLCYNNKLIEKIQHEKDFSSKKCELLKEGSKSSDRFIDVNNKSITNSECTKYFGEHFNNFGTNSDPVDGRVKKLKAPQLNLLLCVKKFSFQQTSKVLCFCHIDKCFFQD